MSVLTRLPTRLPASRDTPSAVTTTTTAAVVARVTTYAIGTPVRVTLRDQWTQRVTATQVPGVVAAVQQALNDLTPLYLISFASGSTSLWIQARDVYSGS